MAKSIRTKPLKRVVKKNSFVRHKYDANTDTGDITLESISITKNGTYYAESGKAFNQITVKVAEYVAPTVNFSITPDMVLYDKKVDTLKNITLTVNITKGTEDISTVRFMLGSTVIKEFKNPTESILQYSYTFDPPTNENQTFSVSVIDAANKTVGVSKKIQFVLKSYYGTVDASVTSPDEALITSLQNKLVGSKGFVYSGITMDYGKVLYAYPVGYGNISTIRDTVNNFTYELSDFIKSSVSIDGSSYYCYLQKDASGAENVQLTFE